MRAIGGDAKESQGRTQLFKLAKEKFFQVPFWYLRNGQIFVYELCPGGLNRFL
ncbi:hypothetical protein P5673_008778 [Acropora cervicornis]|uniref:Uncharacterized protein n=1 Tax=Acropora cervicornis TaxID=6130 RepID=A0AAD9VAP1_ACRCE|nr:hypothetical protein P5673_008778 [Acropora cervicornis]